MTFHLTVSSKEPCSVDTESPFHRFRGFRGQTSNHVVSHSTPARAAQCSGFEGVRPGGRLHGSGQQSTTSGCVNLGLDKPHKVQEE